MSGQTTRTVELLKAGWLTALESAQQGGCLSLSQRCGELQRSGYDVQKRWVDLPSGARVKSYRIINAQRGES